MPIEILPYRPEHVALVKAMNARLEAGGSDWKFYDHAEPRWAPAGQTQGVGREYFVAVDETPAVHGGFCLKRQVFAARGAPVAVASMQGPVSEGLVDPKYAMLAMRMVRDMERREPNLFAWGASERIAGLLGRMGWTRGSAAGATRLFRPGRLLTRLPAARRRRWLNPVLDLAAASGAAALAGAALTLALRLKAGGLGPRPLNTVPVERFEGWADEIWTAAAPHYGLTAVRDAATMNVLTPQGAWPDAVLLRFDEGDRPIGWAALRITDFENDARFGDLRVGSIVDCLALPGYEADVAAAATAHLNRAGCDMSITIMTHQDWLSGLRKAGYFVQPNRRPAYMAPGFKQIFEAEPLNMAAVHLTPLDGDGPHGF